MSALPKRTRTLVKDLLFQEKHSLSHTQTDLMAYLVNVTYWADSVEGYHVIATSKIMSDLPCLGEKSFEALLKILKKLELIESKVVRVTHWRGKPYIRGIKLTQKGQEYNKHIILPTQDKKLRELEQEVKRLHGVDEENQQLKEMLETLTVDAKLSKEEPQEPKEPKEEPTPKPQMPKKEEIDTFIQTVTKHFGANGKPLCNFVPTYQKETTFYINSYNKLSLITPNNDFKQISNPEIIMKFWQWLYLNPKRVGNKIEFSKTSTVKALKQRFINRTINLTGVICTVIDFIEVEDKVKLKVKTKDGSELFLTDRESKKDKIFEREECEKVILGILENSWESATLVQ
jgi:hypothetical protein